MRGESIYNRLEQHWTAAGNRVVADALRGFLLAYLGHQLDEPALIAEGLEVMDESPMRSLLQEIWGNRDQSLKSE